MGGLVGAMVAVVEASTVLILRAHYTMDVFAAVVTAFWAASLAEPLALVADRVVTHLLTQSFGS
jgi:hypothetical protein